MKKLFFSALVLAGTLTFASPSKNVATAEIKNFSTEVLKTTTISGYNEDLPWYTKTTISTYWVLGYPVLVTTKTEIVWYD